jgi:hypothetical protein
MATPLFAFVHPPLKARLLLAKNKVFDVSLKNFVLELVFDYFCSRF